MKTQGQKLKELRISLSLSQEKLAEELGVSIKSIQRYETDKSKPDTYTLVKLATYFDVSSDYLLGLLAFEGDLKEESNKIFLNGKYNKIYSRYLQCKRSIAVDENSEYYWVQSEENSVIGGQTEWVGWLDEMRTLEVRRLRPVIPLRAIEACIQAHSRPMLLNEEEDVIVFRMFGGHAIVRKEICERYLPEFLENFLNHTDEQLHKVSD
ncbi:helix-turn-helix domain-containing protein [Dendrosporobacter sp. 1207_IL3150]|uniref:helix-turn-helix domain-containing protein n=1 Tax=Dendrosporobacter sp. 1207_IL3150 TaxID=3084054 RepID=UPI002FD9870E